MSKHTRNYSVGARCGLLSLRHKSDPERKLARLLSRILSRRCLEFFGPFSRVPKQNHATFGAKIHANFGTFFPMLSRDARPWFVSLLLDASQFWSRNFQRHNPESINSMTCISRGKKFTPDPLCACAAPIPLGTKSLHSKFR